MRPRPSLLAAACGVLALSLAACGGSTPAAEGSASGAGSAQVDSVTIVSGQESQNGALLKELIAAGSAATGVEVDLQMSNDSDVATGQKVLLDLAAGAGPDAVRVTNATYQTLIDAGAAQPLSTCLSSSPDFGDLSSQVLDAITVDDEIYMVPWYVTPNALFLNEDLFVEAGLDPANPPKTFDEVHQAAKKIAALPDKPAGAVIYFGNDYNFQGQVASLGGTVYDPATKTFAADSPQATKVFEAYAKMAADGASPVYTNFFAEANDAFAAGQLGMMVTSASGFPNLSKNADFTVGLAPAPYPDGGKALAVVSTNGFVITTKDPARQQAACDVLLNLVGGEAVTKTVSATATIPINQATIDDPQFLKPVYEANPSWVKVREQNLVTWQSLPDGKTAEYTQNFIDTQTTVLTGAKTPEQAAGDLQAAVDRLLG